MKKLLIIIYLVLFEFVSFSQIEWVNFKNSGQFNDAFSCIEFDNENNPWAGTLLNGVQYYNGTAFKNYTTSNSPILHNKIYDLLYNQQENQMLIATLKGLSTFKENIWINFTTENSNLPSNAILSLAKEGGRIWIGTDNGIVDGLQGIVYNNKNTILKGNLILHICIDSKGNKWFATNEEVARFDGETWTVFSDENSVLPNESVLFITEDSGGIIWVAIGNTYSGTLATIENDEVKIVDKSNLDNLSSRISAIIPFEDGTNWLGTHDKGLIKYKDSVWTAYTTGNSDIPINQIINMKVDRENNLWLAHRNGLTKVETENVLGSDNFSKNEFHMYPNPLKTQARIVIPNYSGNTFHLVVSNVNGQIIRQEYNISNDFLFERKGIKSGIYFLKLYSSKEVFYCKLLVE